MSFVKQMFQCVLCHWTNSELSICKLAKVNILLQTPKLTSHITFGKFPVRGVIVKDFPAIHTVLKKRSSIVGIF